MREGGSIRYLPERKTPLMRSVVEEPPQDQGAPEATLAWRQPQRSRKRRDLVHSESEFPTHGRSGSRSGSVARQFSESQQIYRVNMVYKLYYFPKSLQGGKDFWQIALTSLLRRMQGRESLRGPGC